MQRPGEEVLEHSYALRQPVVTCQFGSAEDTILRDQFLEGSVSGLLRERIFAEMPPPSFSRAVEIA